MKIEERGMYQTYILGPWGHLLRISKSSAAILKHYMKGTFSSCKNRFSIAKVEYTIELAFFHSLFYQTKALPSTKKPVYMSLTERYLSFTYLASLPH